MEPTGLLTIDEAARYLSVSKSSLRRWTRLGKLVCSRVGTRRERRFRREDLDRVLHPDVAASSAPAPAPVPGVASSDPLAALAAAAEQGVARHVALHFRDRDELWRLFRPYVLEHAMRQEPILYVHEENSRADVLTRLRGEGLNPKEMLARGQLRLLLPVEAYLRSGSFSPQRMIDFMEGAILDRRAAGFDSMLISGEMTWCLSGAPGVEGMIEYEAMLNDLLARYPKVTIVCHYDMQRLNGDITLGALCSHPHVHLPSGLLPGYFARMQPGA
jgi:excisionase family DNA binding protein